MLTAQLGYGGAEGAFIRLARELSRQNVVKIAVFTQQYGGGYAELDLPADLDIVTLDDLQPTGRLARWTNRWTQLAALRRSFAEDATISFLSGPNLLNVFAPGPGARIVSIRGSRRFDANSSFFAGLIYRLIIDPVTNFKADALVCVSEGLRLEVAGVRAARGWSKFRTISGYVDADRLIEAASEPIEPEMEQLSNFPLIVAAGRLSPEKGFQHLLRIFAAVRNRVPQAKLLLIGDGPYLAQLQDHCRAVGLSFALGDDCATSANVIFAGYRSTPHRYFRLARVFVLPSSAEGFPNVLVEALASGIPVMAGDVPWGSREVLGVPADPRNRPYPRTEPLRTIYGSLMPRIDAEEYGALWVQELCRQLLNANSGAEAAAVRRARVGDLGCDRAAAKWQDLLREFANRPRN